MKVLLIGLAVIFVGLGLCSINIYFGLAYFAFLTFAAYTYVDEFRKLSRELKNTKK